MGEAPDKRKQLFKSLYFNRTGILLLLMLLASIGMIFISVHVHGTAKEFWLGLGAAVLAASVYSYFQVLLTSRQFDSFLDETVRAAATEAISEAAGSALAEYQNVQRKYVPTATYGARKVPDERFNLDLNESLRTSGHYTFYGLTARYAVARLASLPSVPPDVRFIMGNPAEPAAVDSRARRDVEPGDEDAFKARRDELLRGIHMSIAGVYMNRRRFARAEVCLTRVPPIDRAELCDSAVYLSQFSQGDDPGYQFPSTMRFDRSSLVYQMFDHESSALFNSPYTSQFVITPNTDEAELLDLLGKKGITLTENIWKELKGEFTEFRDEHVGELVPRAN